MAYTTPNMDSTQLDTLPQERQPGAPLTGRIKQEIDAAVTQMKNNITTVGERGERLDHLQDKTNNLADQANGFRRGANRVRKQMWWKDMKMRMCIIVGIIVLLVVIIVPSGEWTACLRYTQEVVLTLRTVIAANK